MLWMRWGEDAQATTFTSCSGFSSGTLIPSTYFTPSRTSDAAVSHFADASQEPSPKNRRLHYPLDERTWEPGQL